MNIKRIVTLGVLGLVFSSALLSANVLVAADQTVMDSAYAADRADEANLDEALETEIERELQATEVATGVDLPINRTADDLLADAITDEYAQAQIEANLDRIYAYLNGDVAALRLEIEIDPAIENILDELDAELQDIGPADFDERLADAKPDEMELNPGTSIEEMTESEAQFLADREAFEERVKERIQAESAESLTDEQLDQAYEDRREEIRADLLDERDQQLNAAVVNGTIPASFEEPVRTISTAWIDGLTSEIGYDTYVQRVETGMDDLRAAALAEAEATIRAQAPETVDLTDEIGAQERQSMETARTATSTVATLTLVLPILALGTAAVVARLYPASVASRLIGTAAVVVGVVGLVGARIAAGPAGNAIASIDGPEAAIRFVELLVSGLFDLLTLQSGGLLVIGVGLVAASVAIRRDLILPDLD